MSVQILHCSDTHLDRNFNIPNLARAAQRKDDLNKNFAQIIEYAIKNKPDIFLITGDVFDKMLPTNASRVFVTQAIRRLKDVNIAVFMIGGNHEVPRFGTVPTLAIDVLSSAGIATVFSHSDKIQKKKINVNGKTVCLSGKSYYTQFEGTNPFKDAVIPLEGDYNILMLHGSLQGLNVAPSSAEMAYQNPFLADDVKKGLNYLALGHFHNYFEREHNDCIIVNPGSIEKLSWAEINDEKGFVWAELNGSQTKTEFIKLETRPMEVKEIDLSKDNQYPDGIIKYILNNLFSSGSPEKMLKVTLRGLISQEQYSSFKVNELLTAGKEMFFNLQINRKELEVEGYGRVFLDRIDNPIEAYSKRLDTMIAQLALDDPQRAMLEQVKAHGIKYLESSL